MTVVAFLATAAFAVVNAFGSWLVSRRKGWIAGLFMLSAALLTVAAAAFVSNIPYTRVLLASGLALAWVTSLLNARVVIGRVRWRNHLVRALVVLAVYALGELAVR